MKKSLLLTIFVSVLIANFSAFAANSTSSFTPDQTQQIQQIVHEYLVKNPQVLVEASQALQQQQMAQMQKTAGKAIADNAKDLFNNPASPVLGNPNGNVTVIEFMDYQCPHCKDMGPVIQSLTQSDSNLRIIIKELPIFGPTSEYAAKAALAAQKQGKYKEFHYALMKDQNPLNKDEVMKIAKEVGLDTNKLAQDIEDPVIAQQLKDNYTLAQKLGLMGTPAFIIGTRPGEKTAFIPGTTSPQNLQQVITQMRK